MKACSHLTFRQVFLYGMLLYVIAYTKHTSANEGTYSDLLIEDIQQVVSAPARWQTDDWQTFGWASIAVLGTSIIIDQRWRDEMRQLPQNNKIMNLQALGAEYSIVVIGGFYLSAILTNNDTSLLVAQDTLTASIIASGIITPAIKIATGRSRPYENAGTHNFQSLNSSTPNSSFPSGHTTEAFALASVISAHYEDSWITTTVYTTATLVGVARTYYDAHFASDVVAGALIGNWVGKSIVTHNQTLRNSKMTILPETTQDLIGLRLVGQF